MTQQAPPTHHRTDSLQTRVAGKDPQEARLREMALTPALQEMEVLTKGKASVSTSAFVSFVDRFGYSFLTDDAVRTVAEITRPHGGKVISAFTGLGYAEAQMVGAGMEVIGFDREVKSKRWLLDTHEVVARTPVEHFSDRALFMSFPEVSEGARSEAAKIVSKYLASGGSTVIVITEARPRAHAIKSDAELLARLKCGECVAEIALPKWPAIDAFMGYGNVHHTFEPVLKAYRFR